MIDYDKVNLTQFSTMDLIDASGWGVSMETISNMSLDDNFDTFLNESAGNYTRCPSTAMPGATYIFMILYTIVCLVGVMGNTLVIYVVLRFSNMQTVTNMYILNLAIADECFLIGIPFLIITMHLKHWAFGYVVCKMYMVSTSITQFTSSIFLFIMSGEFKIIWRWHICDMTCVCAICKFIISNIHLNSW